MIGMLLWQSPGKHRRAVVAREESILHVRFFCVEVLHEGPEFLLRRRIQKAAKWMARAGIQRLVTPPAFEYGDLLAAYHLGSVSTLSLRRQLAADWIQALLAERGGGIRVAVTGNELTGELVRTVTELSLRYRYVLLDVPYGGEELGRQLRREYGVSLLLEPTREQLEEADGLLLFQKREDLHNPVMLPLYEEAEGPLPQLALPPTLEERLPAGADRAQLLAVLREAGVLRPGQIAIAS